MGQFRVDLLKPQSIQKNLIHYLCQDRLTCFDMTHLTHINKFYFIQHKFEI